MSHLSAPREAGTNYPMTRSQPECDCLCEHNGGLIVSGELVVSNSSLAVLASADYRERVLATQRSSDAIGTVVPIGNEPLYAGSILDQLIGGLHVGGVARCENEAQRSPKNADERMILVVRSPRETPMAYDQD